MTLKESSTIPKEKSQNQKRKKKKNRFHKTSGGQSKNIPRL